MARFEIKNDFTVQSHKNLRITGRLLEILPKVIPSFNKYYLDIEFNINGKAIVTKCWFDNGWHTVDL